MIDSHHRWNVSLKPSFLAFVFSLILIFATHRIVAEHHLAGSMLMFTIFVIALMQTILQLVFFMHLGMGSKPHWNAITFLFTVIVIILVIGGSVWIMNNLNYNLMMDMGKS